MSIIGKAESISHGRAAVKYAEEKQINGVDVADSFEMHGLSGETPEECFNEMRNWKNGTGHDNIKRDFLWLSFSPSKELIEQWGDDETKWTTRSVLLYCTMVLKTTSSAPTCTTS